MALTVSRRWILFSLAALILSIANREALAAEKMFVRYSYGGETQYVPYYVSIYEYLPGPPPHYSPLPNRQRISLQHVSSTVVYGQYYQHRYEVTLDGFQEGQWYKAHYETWTEAGGWQSVETTYFSP